MIIHQTMKYINLRDFNQIVKSKIKQQIILIIKSIVQKLITIK